ncbi:MAG: PD-(D/E)XK nuclease family protein [Saprospiraceae bacterium]|jgi:ATP-dependent helicase/nuclease subunit B
MKIFFGLSLDHPVRPLPEWIGSNAVCAGPVKFLQLLEGLVGRLREEKEIDYLRVEEYRQALRAYLANSNGGVFYRDAFAADPFAVAAELLDRRDELRLAGWDFSAKGAIPDRLASLAAIEAGVRNGSVQLSRGFAERFTEMLQALPRRRHPISEIRLVEPRALFPVHWKKLLELLEGQGVLVAEGAMMPGALSNTPAAEENDLLRFQRLLTHGRQAAGRLEGDGSLVLLKGRRDTDLAAYFAAWAKRNPSWDPVLLLPDLSGTLDYALVQEGIPSLGLQTVSLARPALQVLKLLPVFLWSPLDPFKLLEFVSLPVKPLEEELAARIARQLADKPGILGASWHGMIAEYFRVLDAGRFSPSEHASAIRRQYQMWFERRRYDSSGEAPKADAIEMFTYLAQWAGEKYARGEGGVSMHLLRVQAQRIADLLLALPESHLSSLELERIIRTIYEAAPLQLRAQEQGSFTYAQEPGAILAPVDNLVWWNFCGGDPAFIFSRWSVEERQYLEQIGVLPDGPEREQALLTWQKKRPVLLARKTMVLVMPAFSGGEAMLPHALIGDLEAGFERLDPIILEIGRPGVLPRYGNLPDYVLLQQRRLGQPAPFIQLGKNVLLPRARETFSSFETLLYFPHRWVFQYVLRLRKSPILSIVEDRTLYGNLVHRLFEGLLREPGLSSWDKATVYNYITGEMPGLLAREGAVLLLYGQEPARVQFVKKVQYAAWSLVSLMRDNGWEILDTERPVEGRFADLEIHGRADIVLRRGGERAILDLKWGGLTFRRASIKNREDLQLILYSALLDHSGPTAHSAYFIVENATLLARNNAAFRDVSAVDPKADSQEIHEEILRRMETTFKWRSVQLQQGQIEVRCSQTEAALNEHYQESLLDLLEMQRDNHRFEDYQTLINLVR